MHLQSLLMTKRLSYIPGEDDQSELPDNATTDPNEIGSKQCLQLSNQPRISFANTIAVSGTSFTLGILVVF